MRLKERDLLMAYLKKRKIIQDNEGIETVTYVDPVTVKINIQSAGGKVNAQIYGNRLQNMKTVKYQGDLINEAENELDGLCVYVGEEEIPDFEIVSIQTFSTHKNIMLERKE